MSKLFTKQPMNWQKSRRFKSLDTYTVKTISEKQQASKKKLLLI